MPQLCNGCPYNRATKPFPKWLGHLNWIYSVLQSGMPVKQNDLPLEMWSDLGELATHIEAKRAGLGLK